jgi:hypothetical protein
VELKILCLILGRYDPDIFRGDKTMDPLDRLSKKGIFSRDLQHLLRAGFPT